MQAFLDRSARCGLTARQRRLLTLRSYYESTQYETVVVEGREVDARPWDLEVDPNTQCRIPAAYRRPSVQLGTTATIVDRLVDLAVGLDRFPVITDEGEGAATATEGGATVREVLLDDDQIALEAEAAGQAVDLAVVGAVVFGFHRPDDLDGRFEPVRLAAEWCEPVFVGARHTARALELAAEYAAEALEGAAELVADGPDDALAFAAPAGARSDDVCFVRYEYPVAPEVDATGQTDEVDDLTWIRRDYTTRAIVSYAPIVVRPGEDRGVDRFRPLPVTPHDWGVVPLVWLRARGAGEGDLEGRSVYSPAVISSTESADRSASYWAQAAQVSGSPVLVEIDATDFEQAAAIEAASPANGTDPSLVPVGPRSVLRYRTDGENPSVGYLEMTGGGTEALERVVRGLVQAARRAARVPEIDPELLKGVLSGVALERLNEPAVALAGALRAILERGWRLLARKVAIVLGVADPELAFRWPRVFQPTAADVVAWSQALVPIVAGGLYPRRRAVAKVAELLDDEGDPDEILAEILEERGEGIPTAAAVVELPVDEDE